MNNKVKLIITSLSFVALIFVAVFAYDNLIAMGHRADNILIYDLPTSYDNYLDLDDDVILLNFNALDWYENPIQLSDFFGKPTVLNFWASWCPQCIQESPNFQAIYDTMGDEINIVKVNLLDGHRETRATLERFMYENSYTFPVILDITGQAAHVFDIHTIPVTFFLNSEGHVVARAQGAVDLELLKYGISLASVS